MKVYAEFITEGEINYRKTTILQFGESWDLIGSAVLKNPGSASPKKPIGDLVFREIQKIDPKFKREYWWEFKDDPTMRYLENIYNGSYLGVKKDLNGIILLFNLFYIKNQNIDKAKKQAENNNSENLHPIAEEIIPYFRNRPVFLGWRYEYIDHNRTFAEKIFEYVKTSRYMYLKNEMIDNNFYHPGYIQIFNKRNEKVKEVLKAFAEHL